MATSLEGRRVPDATFRFFKDGRFTDVRTDQLFNNQSIVAFALPGAFTPTCSSNHFPRYLELAQHFFDNGVDAILCISVNDSFVLDAWSKDQGNDDTVVMVPDGNGEFTKQLGMLLDLSSAGLGHRSRRYSMLVRDGLIEKAFVEPNVVGDPYAVSDADTMLAYLCPSLILQPDITVFTKATCPVSHAAKEWLKNRSLSFSEVVVGKDVSNQVLRAVSGSTKVPQIFVSGHHIGGFDELQTREAWIQSGEAREPKLSAEAGSVTPRSE
ncbi:Thioredoxin domain-containing protein [Plasmodiophora brassicae]